MKKILRIKIKRALDTKILLASFVCILLATSSFGQKKDTMNINRVPYPNVVKLSLTSWALYANSLHMGYERVIGKHQSISIFGGYNTFPIDLSLNLTGTSLTSEKSKSGYMIGAEYRFYLPRENKYDAPHGLYLAPYFSYYHFSADRTLTHTDSAGYSQSAILNTKIGLFNIGGMLGYQFVVAKRFVIDCELLGPSLTFYSFEADLNGQINGIDPDGTLQAVLTALKNKFPLLNDLSKGTQIIKSGVANSNFSFIGFRYCISIGFMF
ncbi:MAG: hypothetical protein ACHQET_12655 [Chitinophagales bacterium]